MTVFIMMVATVCQTPSVHNASSLPLAWWVQWLLESEDFCQDSWGWDRSPACQALESGFFTAPWVAPPPCPHQGCFILWAGWGSSASEVGEWIRGAWGFRIPEVSVVLSTLLSHLLLICSF